MSNCERKCSLGRGWDRFVCLGRGLSHPGWLRVEGKKSEYPVQEVQPGKMVGVPENCPVAVENWRKRMMEATSRKHKKKKRK